MKNSLKVDSNYCVHNLDRGNQLVSSWKKLSPGDYVVTGHETMENMSGIRSIDRKGGKYLIIGIKVTKSSSFHTFKITIMNELGCFIILRSVYNDEHRKS